MKQWKTVIQAKTGLFDVNWKEVWSYRDLILLLVKKNYQVSYKQTILGPVWMLITPIFSSGVFSLIFGNLGGFSSNGIPYFLFYMAGHILWSFFSDCVNQNTSIFLNNSYLFGKIYFPRLAVPISNVIFSLIKFMIQFGIFLIVWVFFFVTGQPIAMNVTIMLLPFLLLQLALLGMAIGLIVSSVTTKYRDLNVLVGLAMQLLMYASPVIYPISQLPRAIQKYAYINPLASIIETFRYAFTGTGAISVWGLGFSAAVTVGLFLVAVLLFNQTEKNFIDVV